MNRFLKCLLLAEEVSPALLCPARVKLCADLYHADPVDSSLDVTSPTSTDVISPDPADLGVCSNGAGSVSKSCAVLVENYCAALCRILRPLSNVCSIGARDTYGSRCHLTGER